MKRGKRGRGEEGGLKKEGETVREGKRAVNGGEAKLQLHNMASYMYMYMTLHMYIIN